MSANNKANANGQAKNPQNTSGKNGQRKKTLEQNQLEGLSIVGSQQNPVRGSQSQNDVQRQNKPNNVISKAAQVQENKIVNKEDEEKKRLAAEARKQKLQNLKIRAISATCILSFLALIITMGHFYLSFGVIIMIIVMYYEILNVTDDLELRKQTRFSVFLMLNITVSLYMFLPQKVLKRTLLDQYFGEKSWIDLIIFEYHFLICFLLEVAIAIGIVINLIVHGNFKYQVKAWGKSFLLSYLLAFAGCCTVYLNYQGIFWFLFPVLSVTINDISAYLVGISMGKTPLIKISPKKTQEGFIGGAVGSFIVCFIMSSQISNSYMMICPQTDHGLQIFQRMTCDIPEVFVSHRREIFLGPLGSFSMNISQIQFHALVISLFTSLIAPFGGFMASGFKRAFKIKDFADTIPGHGGFTDRFDCKIMTMVFIYFYHTQIIQRSTLSLELAFQSYQMMESQDKQNFVNVLSTMIGNHTMSH
eukprot:403373767